MQQPVSYGVALSGLHDFTATSSHSLDSLSYICLCNVWNSDKAHFKDCFLPVVAAIPALSGAFLILLQALRAWIPWRPRWTRPFVQEIQEAMVVDDIIPLRRWTPFTIGLLMCCGASVVLQLTAALISMPLSIDNLPILGWFIVLLELLIYRPRTVPYGVFTILFWLVIVQAILLERSFWWGGVLLILRLLTLTCGVFALTLLLFMPLQDSHLTLKNVSIPFTSPTSILRSPEEALNIWQFMTVSWMKPLMKLGSARQLEFDDVWSLPYEFQHRKLHENFRELKGTVIRRLIIANGIDLVIVTLLGLIEQFTQYAAPIFLQLILRSLENPETPKQVPLRYAALGLCASLLSAQVGVFGLWFGRRCYERSRGEMITMLYEKTLGRKIAFSQVETNQPEVPQPQATNGHATQRGSSKRSDNMWSTIREKISSLRNLRKPPSEVKESASMGKILNLMRNDVYEVAQRFWEFDNLVKKPVAIILSVSLVVKYLGWPSMMAVALVIFAQVMNSILARVLVHYEKKRRRATDSKLQAITQFVEAIRHLRWYGWQGAWLSQVLSARQKELNWRIVSSIWNLVISFINTIAYDLTPVVAFATYTLIAKKPLTVDLAFPSLQLFSMMTAQLKDLPNLIIALINAWVAVGRIEDFMAEADKEDNTTEPLIGDNFAIQNASFAWPGTTMPVLHQINVSFPPGITVIYGEVASGKSAMLQALLGEMDMLEGQLVKPQDSIGYCAQTPWLQSMSIRENILFSAQYDDERYRAVLEACALNPDLAEFKAGDRSMIGENGIGLSGGQRARVALARAVYSRTQILLLDDPLAALDQQTAQYIVQKCFAGHLLAGRTIILVTHRTDLVLNIAEQAIKLENGHAMLIDLEDVTADHKVIFHPNTGGEENDVEDTTGIADIAVPDKFIEDEHRAYGGVQLRVYWEYVKAGALSFWGICIVILIVYRLIAVTEVWFIKEWGERYNTRATYSLHAYHEDGSYRITGLFDKLPAPEEDIRPWLLGFFVLAFGQSLAYIASQGMLLVIVYTAAKNMFREIIEKVAYATFRFYDVTPVGRLMNRMTSDIGVIDGGISQQFAAISWMVISWVSAIVVIASITPTFLVFTVILITLFIWIFRQFIPTSQSLRRLEMVSLTPLMSNFGELLHGLATVRAFRAQSRFQDRVIQVVDAFQKMDHFYWSLQAWLSYRYDILSALATFVLFLLAVATNLSAGLTAFALLSASKFVNTTHGLCRQYGLLQMEFVSVERVVELTHLEQEPQGSVNPPAWWPSFNGDIVFKNVTIKYAPHLDPALLDVTFTVKGGSKTAIIGRTGSGKSTLALAMLATVLPDKGHILVDNVNLAEVDKQLLRTKVTFLAQDPVLFSGTMRQNLDPVNEHSNEECELILSRVCERQSWKLDSKVEAGGRNLSQGQRQLVGLARAVLRHSAIIILDEATASIDRETAMQIQQVMHEEMKHSTVITIAHRLEAVRNADYCIILGKGRVLEQGPAAEMLGEREEEVSRNIDEAEL